MGPTSAFNASAQASFSRRSYISVRAKLSSETKGQTSPAEDKTLKQASGGILCGAFPPSKGDFLPTFCCKNAGVQKAFRMIEKRALNHKCLPEIIKRSHSFLFLWFIPTVPTKK
jgi:hypothetical protein